MKIFAGETKFFPIELIVSYFLFDGAVKKFNSSYKKENGKRKQSSQSRGDICFKKVTKKEEPISSASEKGHNDRRKWWYLTLSAP